MSTVFYFPGIIEVCFSINFAAYKKCRFYLASLGETVIDYNFDFLNRSEGLILT